MKPRVDVIELLQRVNPVPPGTTVDVDDDFETFLGSSMERTDTMSQTRTDRPPTTGPTPQKWPKYVVAAAALVIAVGLVVPLTGPVAGVDWGETPAEQREVIEGVIEAVNSYDASAFATHFADTATFNASTYVSFVDRETVRPVEDEDLVAALMAINQAWETEIRLESCAPEGEQTVRCAARVLWQVASTEYAAEWLSVFDGDRLASAGLLPTDLDPSPRTLPLSWVDLTGGDFLAWLADDDPALFALIDITGGGADPLMMGTVAFESNLFQSMDPSLADDIGRSVERYLQER